MGLSGVTTEHSLYESVISRMDPLTPLSILAAVPGPGVYVNLVKVAVVLLLIVGWAATMQWVDRDTDLVKTKREQWNMITLSGSIVAFLVLLLPPWKGPALFVAGLGLWFVIAGGAVLAYVIHRNGRVVPAARVLTAEHIKRLLSGNKGKKSKIKDKGQRIRISDHAGKSLGLPDEAEDAMDYQTVQDFLYDLLWRRASEVDLLAGKEKFRLVYRIDGVATERPEGVPPEDGERIFRYLKRVGGLNVEEIRRPQTGRLQVAMLAQAGSVPFTEVQTSGTTAGERLRLRFQGGPTVMRLHEIGLPEARQEMVKQLIAKSHGLVLISSPAQSGLTTTAYAILKSHDAYMQNIHAIERRPLAELDNITQKQYEGANNDVNYARMLQSVLRREPDIVLVGECEDRETAQIASRAGAEDRKIYLAIAGKDCFDALSKYLTFLEDNKLASRAFIGAINQRLIRKLCTDCREAYQPDADLLKRLNLPANKIEKLYRPPTEPVVDKKGNEIICPKCQGTGYVGRTGVFEVLVADDVVRALIVEGAAVDRIKNQCRKNKMYYLQEEAILKVIDGTTSIDEVLRCLRESSK